MRKSFQFNLFNNRRKHKKLNDELYIFCTIYKHSLALIKRHYKIFKNPGKYNLQKQLKRLIDSGLRPKWRSLGYSQAIQDITDRLYKSYQAFFSLCKKPSDVQKSPPKFEAFRKYKSFTLKQTSWKLDQERGVVTIKNQYRYNNIFLTNSKNEQIKSPEFLKQSLKQLKAKSKKLSAKIKGSKNRYKARNIVSRLHQKISNQRQDFHFKLAHNLIHKYDHLFFEDLNLDGMKRLWSRKVSDLGLYQLLQRIEFTAKEHGKIIRKIDSFYPSSKTCCKCDIVKEGLGLKDRRFECECGHELERDLNAATNIRTLRASKAGLEGVTRELALASVA